MSLHVPTNHDTFVIRCSRRPVYRAISPRPVGGLCRVSGEGRAVRVSRCLVPADSANLRKAAQLPAADAVLSEPGAVLQQGSASSALRQAHAWPLLQGCVLRPGNVAPVCSNEI